MAIYGQVTPSQERYLDFRATLTSENLNKKQVKFWTDEPTFVVRGFQVTYDPNIPAVTITKGALVKDYVLIVLPNDISITLNSPVNCMSVVLRYQYLGSSCGNDAEILVIDNTDFDPNTMVFLACIDNNVVIYPLDPADSCCGQVRKELRFISDLYNCCNVVRYYCQPTSTITEIPLLVEADNDDRIHLYVNGALLTQGVDYTIDRSTPGAYKFVLLTSNVDPNDIIQQVVICGQDNVSSVGGVTCV